MRRPKQPPAKADAVAMLESWARRDPMLQRMLAEERTNAAVARQLYELRTAHGLTQRQLADLIGTKQSVIARLEDADYQGHSLSTLTRIADALGCAVRVSFVRRTAPATRAHRTSGHRGSRRATTGRGAA